jgi:hypothetical protein
MVQTCLIGVGGCGNSSNSRKKRERKRGRRALLMCLLPNVSLSFCETRFGRVYSFLSIMIVTIVHVIFPNQMRPTYLPGKKTSKEKERNKKKGRDSLLSLFCGCRVSNGLLAPHSPVCFSFCVCLSRCCRSDGFVVFPTFTPFSPPSFSPSTHTRNRTYAHRKKASDTTTTTTSLFHELASKHSLFKGVCVFCVETSPHPL